MKNTKQHIGINLLIFLLVGCGVKSRPLPPLEPLQIGNGSLKSEEVQTKKQNKQELKR
jgi:hypothetical protein